MCLRQYRKDRQRGVCTDLPVHEKRISSIGDGDEISFRTANNGCTVNADVVNSDGVFTLAACIAGRLRSTSDAEGVSTALAANSDVGIGLGRGESVFSGAKG